MSSVASRNGDDERVKVKIEMASSYSVYPRPETRFYMVATVGQVGCKNELPHWAEPITKGKKIHLQTEEGLYDLNNPEEAAFWNNLDELLKTESCLVVTLKNWKPASEKGKPRGFKELDGVFTFDWAVAPCITM